MNPEELIAYLIAEAELRIRQATRRDRDVPELVEFCEFLENVQEHVVGVTIDD